MTGSKTVGRRERLRIETTAEVKSVAMQLMASGGPGAITLRAIAREMRMTPNAIYGYFASRDDLVTTLISDVYSSFADAIEVAVNDVPAAEVSGRIHAWASAFRNWALANPEGFRLIYGDSVPGYVPPAGGAAPGAELRFCRSLTTLTAAAWPYAENLHAESAFQWSDFDPIFRDEIRQDFPDLPPAAIALSLRIWGRVHGIAALEIYGHLRAGTTNMDKLFQEELAQLVRSLGIPSNS
ncbi:TetR/AcrR family transcriptional regulator [Amycolatopsis sp. TRM77291]